MAALYARLGAPTVLTDAASAEMIKYAANCFLAMKLSYVNAIAELCERLDADIADVTEGMGYDKRIGQAFLQPGPGWGGSCLPKDTTALLQVADAVDFEFRLLRATIDTNTRQCQRMVDKVRIAVTGKRGGSLSKVRLGLLGLTFKAGTDDLRDSPALAVAALLRQAGAELVAYDPALRSGDVRADLDGIIGGRRPVRGGQGRRRAGGAHRVAGVPHAGLGAAGRRGRHARSWWTPATCSTPTWSAAPASSGKAWAAARLFLPRTPRRPAPGRRGASARGQRAPSGSDSSAARTTSSTACAPRSPTSVRTADQSGNSP